MCSVVWCGAVRCGAVRCGAVRCGAVRCGAVRCLLCLLLHPVHNCRLYSDCLKCPMLFQDKEGKLEDYPQEMLCG